MKKTMVGIAPSPASAPPNVSPPLPGPAHQQTIMGMAPMGPARGSSAAPSGSEAPPGHSTVTGLPSPLADTPPAFNQAPLAGLKRTILGVAMPGIAPLAPGIAKQNSSSPPPATGGGPAFPAFEPSKDPGSRNLYSSSRAGLARESAPPKAQHGSALIALIGGMLLAAAAAAFALFWRSPAPLRAEARVDASGHDVLHITCPTCPDGTELRIGDSRSKVVSQAADLSLSAPLKVGDNTFSVGVDRPASGRDEQVSLLVKIGYRIRPDLTLLGADRPMLRVDIEGTPGSSMTVDGKGVVLNAQGKASYDVDLTSDCSGLADEPKSLDRSVAYSVVGASGAPEAGTVAMRVTVPSLHVDFPGPHTVIESDHVTVAGRTAKGARVLVGTTPIPVAADGTFSQVVRAAPLLGDNRVELRTTVPGQASRIAEVHVKRVARLADEARDFAAKAPLTFTDLIGSLAGHIGDPIVLTGEVAEARPAGATLVSLIEVLKGCARPPCLSRVVSASDPSLSRGDRVQVFGHVTRAVSAKGDSATVPEIVADFLLKKN